MPRQQLIYSPFIVRKVLLVCVLDWMDGRVTLVIVFAIAGALPHFAIVDPFGEVPEGLALLEISDYVLQVDCRVVLGCLCARVAQESPIIELLHNCHGLLRADPQLSRNQLCRFHSVQWLRPELCLWFLVDIRNASDSSVFNTLVKGQHHMLVKKMSASPCELGLFLFGFIPQLYFPKGFLHEVYNLLVTLHYEPKGRKLAGTVADH